MQAGPQDRVQQGIFLCRGITSVILSFFTFVAILSADIGISVDYGNILMSDEGKIQPRVDRGFESRSGQTKDHTIGI
jgi:hypothetical protein